MPSDQAAALTPFPLRKHAPSKGWLVWLVWFVWLVWSVWLVVMEWA